MWSRMTKKRRVRPVVLVSVNYLAKKRKGGLHKPILSLSPKQTQVDFEDGFEETHVGTLVKTDLVLPKIDDENL